MTERPVKQRLKLILLAALFFAPLIAAWTIFFGPAEWRPGARVENGRLVHPARPMPALDWEIAQIRDGDVPVGAKWTLIQIAQGECGDECRERLWQTRQLRATMHRHRGRVQRLLVAATPAQATALVEQLAGEHPQLIIASLAAGQLASLKSFFADANESRPLFLVDPLGNWMMVYGDDVPLRGIYKDLKKLLRTSQIG